MQCKATISNYNKQDYNARGARFTPRRGSCLTNHKRHC